MTLEQPPLTLDTVLVRVRLVQPALVDEWQAARVEAKALAAALGVAVSGDEDRAVVAARALAANAERVAVRMARASRALSQAYEAITVQDVACSVR